MKLFLLQFCQMVVKQNCSLARWNGRMAAKILVIPALGCISPMSTRSIRAGVAFRDSAQAERKPPCTTNRVATQNRVRRLTGEGTVQGQPNLIKDGCNRPLRLNAGCSGSLREKTRVGIGKPLPVASKSEAKRPRETVAPKRTFPIHRIGVFCSLTPSRNCWSNTL